MATKTKNDRTLPVKEWASGGGDEKKLRDMMGLSNDTPAVPDGTSERTVPNGADAYTPSENGDEATELTAAAPITADDSDIATTSDEGDKAASSVLDRSGEISGCTIIITDDEVPEQGDDAMSTESDVQTLPSEGDKVGARTPTTQQGNQPAPSACGEETRLIAESDPIRRTVKQRKSGLSEYRATFLFVPKIIDRKPVFVSGEVRDKLDRIVRLLGERGMSVSGLVENIALHHFAIHEADIEHWRKM